MIHVDCSRFMRFELELAAYLSEKLDGSAIALVRDKDIIIDQIFGADVASPSALVSAVDSFFVDRSIAGECSARLDGEKIVIFAPEGYAKAKDGEKSNLPPNVYQCAHCGYITQDETTYRLHERSHTLAPFSF